MGVKLTHDSPTPDSHPPGQQINLLATPEGFGDESLIFEWILDGVSQTASSSSVNWSTPSLGQHTIMVRVSDNLGRRTEASVAINVLKPQEEAPQLLINGQPFDPEEGLEINLSEGELNCRFPAKA